jgi:hypothetical protein
MPKAARVPGTKIKLAELARRITGFSVPVFGLQWTPPKSERESVRALLTFLEDRRVLYTPENLEVVSEVERSVQEIRRRCTEILTELPEQSPAALAIRMIRAACRSFLDGPRADFRNLYPRDLGDMRDRAGFFTALGELRASVGVQLAILAGRYEIELEAALASIVPFDDWDEDV